MYELQPDQRKKMENWHYHPPKPGQPERYTLINNMTANTAMVMFTNCPPSRELSLAITKLEEARMWANAAIALNE